jgi:hypothetical protein
LIAAAPYKRGTLFLMGAGNPSADVRVGGLTLENVGQ